MNKKLLLKEIKAVIFDFDNTLVNSDKFVIDHLKKTANRVLQSGLPIQIPTDEQIKSIQAQNPSFDEIFQKLFLGKHEGKPIWELILADYRTDSTTSPIQPTSQAIQAINELIDLGFTIGIVSNRINLLEERLKQSGFNPEHFSFMCMPPSKEFSKPHPRAFEVAIEELRKKGIDPEETIMIGDHPDDYYSSFYQNISFVGILQGQSTRENFTKAGVENNLLFDDLSNIENILNEVIKVRSYKISLQSTSALDGRHKNITNSLRHYFSEYALHKYRVKAEIEHIIALSEFTNGQVVRFLSGEEKLRLRKLYKNFSLTEGYEVMQYDHLSRNGIGPTEHDVKSCELWLQEKLTGTTLEDVIPALHMFVTSADINNLAYKTMLAEATGDIFVPTILDITDKLKELANNFAYNPVMSRTHMQPASPTTFGKIFAGYLTRLTNGLERLKNVKLTGKINGAVGNYNTFKAAYPDVNWIKYSEELCNRMGFETELWTDQRGTHVDMVQTFQAIQEIGNVLRDLAQDLSLYAGFKTMYFSKVESHVGSSVMPHKINPWFAEVAEGSIKKANALINGFSNDIDVSRLQRDLSDHEWERSYGEMVGYVLVSIEHLKIALNLIRPDTEFAKEELNNHPEIVSEAIQTILRKHGHADAYNLLKEKTRGKKITKNDLLVFIGELNFDDTIKQELRNVVEPEKYLGSAVELTKMAIEKYERFKSKR